LAAASDLENFDSFLLELRHSVGSSHPHLTELFDVFAQEARFGRSWLASSLLGLPSGSELLEVGGGLMLLSVQLQREGYQVTALEPIGVGFSSFLELQGLVLKFATSAGCAPSVLPLRVEDFELKSCFDFAFSINVMEHVSNVPLALANVVTALKSKCTYRFLCPNYVFPYEPHFNIPTLLSKSLTERVFKNQIFSSTRVSDPVGMWASLNWISVRFVAREVAKIKDCAVRFERTILRDMFLRVVDDEQFAERRSAWVKSFSKLLVQSRLHHLLALLPASFLPLMDCSVTRKH